MAMAQDISCDTASLSIELVDLRKEKKADAKKIRQMVTEEYECLVKDLVAQVSLLGNRLNEFRSTTMKQVMDIITDSKREEMECIEAEVSMPVELRQKMTHVLGYEEELAKLKNENHECRMTVGFYCYF